MYLFKNDKNVVINKTLASEKIGISRVHLSNILNSKTECTKRTAYCITKFLDNDAEISEYFTKKGE